MREYRITLSPGAEPQLVLIRPLDHAQMSRWYDHVTVVFSYKETVTRQMFVDHFELDPGASHMDILVAVAPSNGQILSSLRIFRRHMWICGTRLSMGGIGEVSTNKSFEGLGLAKLLLKAAIERMNASGVQVTCLHTSNASFLYEKMGWIPYPVPRELVPVDVGAIRRWITPHSINCRWSQLSDDDITLMASLHAAYVRTCTGPLDRDDREYWLRWVRNESLPEKHHRQPQCFLAFEGTSTDTSIGPLLMYMIVEAPKIVSEPIPMTRLYIKECVWNNTEANHAATIATMTQLLQTVLEHFRAQIGDSSKVYFNCASVVAALLDPSCKSAGESIPAADQGHMIQVLRPFALADGTPITTTQDLIRVMDVPSSDPRAPVFFGTDGY